MSHADRIEAEVPIQHAEAVAADVASNASIGVSGFGSVGYPKAVPLALAESDCDLRLTIISGGAVGEEIEDTLAKRDAIARRYPFATRPEILARANDGRTAFRDRHVSQVGDEVRYGGLPSLDLAVVEAVAVGEGWLVPSTSIGQTPAFVEAADRLIVEVNSAQPRDLAAFHDIYRPKAPPDREPIMLDDVGGRIGSPRVEFDPSDLAAVVCTDRSDSTYEFREPTAMDETLGANLATFLTAELQQNPALDTTVNLEFGVGSVGNALLGALGDIDFGDRQVNYFGEVFQDGLLDALETGDIESASATSFALSENGQQRLFDNLDRFADDVVLRPAEVSNHPALIDRFGVVAINAAVEVDLYGHVNSTHVGGSRLVGGLGGSGDFTRHGLVSIVACPSTAKDGDISRIVPMATHVDHTEHDVDVVVTDHGVADLRGTSPVESAEKLIEVADPSVRSDLRAYLDRAGVGSGHISHDLDTAFDWRT